MKPFLMEDEPVGMQMAPLIDITFLLIVFFMVAANVTQSQKVKVDLAEASQARTSKDQSSRTFLTVTATGDYYLGADLVTLDDITRLLTLERVRIPDLKLFLRADQGTDYGNVRKAMAASAEAGLIDVIFSTYEQ